MRGVPCRLPLRTSYVFLAAAIFMLAQALPPSLRAQSENPWNFLADFTLVPGSIVQIQEHYVAALFRDPQKRLSAVVLYTADCDSRTCTIGDSVAYVVFDAQGIDVRHYVNPKEKPEIKNILNLQRLI